MIPLALLAVVCVIWAVMAAQLITNDLRKRGHPVSFVWLRAEILTHPHRYIRITREQDGRVGPLFYHYIIPLNVALVLAVLAVRA